MRVLVYLIMIIGLSSCGGNIDSKHLLKDSKIVTSSNNTGQDQYYSDNLQAETDKSKNTLLSKLGHNDEAHLNEQERSTQGKRAIYAHEESNYFQKASSSQNSENNNTNLKERIETYGADYSSIEVSAQKRKSGLPNNPASVKRYGQSNFTKPSDADQLYGTYP